MARMRPAWALEQGRMVGTYDPEEECILEFTVPMQANDAQFRIGWSLKGLRHSGYIAISTGEYIWNRREIGEAALHITFLLEEVSRMLEGVPRDPRS